MRPAERLAAMYDLVLSLSRYAGWSRTEVLSLGLSEVRQIHGHMTAGR